MKKILVLLLSLLTFGLNAQGTKLKIKQLENPGTSSLNLGANSFSAGAQSTISTLYVPNTATVNGALLANSTGTIVTSLQTPTVFGSSASGGTLYLSSTTDATKGNIVLGVNGGTANVPTQLVVGSNSISNSFMLSVSSTSLNNSDLYLNGVNNSRLFFKNNGTSGVLWRLGNQTVAGSHLDDFSIYQGGNPDVGFLNIANSTGYVMIQKNTVIGSMTPPASGAPTLNVVGDASVSTNFTASGTASVGSTFTVNGAMKALNTLSVGSTFTSNGAAYCNSTFSVVSTSSFSDQISLKVNKQFLHAGDVSVGSSRQWAFQNDVTAFGDFALYRSTTNTGGATTRVMYFDASGNLVTSGTMSTAANFTAGARVEQAQGAAVASANNLTLGGDGNSFEITGTTQINLISRSSWQDGSVIRLLFTSTPTVKNGQTTSSTNMTILLAGAADFVATADDILTLELCTIGGVRAWREVSRSIN